MHTDDENEVKVWDPLVRIFHWALVIAFGVAYFTEDDFMTLHSYAGYLVAGLVAFRLLWGFMGGRHARFSDFVQRPRVVIDYMKQASRFQAPRYLGHNPAAGTMIIALLIMLALSALSGIALYGAADNAGPMAGLFSGRFTADVLEEVHEFLANFTVFLVILHVAGVLFSSMEHGENLVRSMINGRKRA